MNCNTAMSHTAVMCEINAPCSHDAAILLTKLRTANGTKKAATLSPSLDNQHLYEPKSQANKPFNNSVTAAIKYITECVKNKYPKLESKFLITRKNS